MLGSIIISALGAAVVAIAASLHWDLSILATFLVYGLVGAGASLVMGYLRFAAAEGLQRRLMSEAEARSARSPHQPGLQLNHMKAGDAHRL